ncbi:hypothetical protein K3495_g14908, partial [Podosphaera aphanis]
MKNCDAFLKCQEKELAEQADKNRPERGSRQMGYLARTDDQSNENNWPYPSAAPCVTGQALLSLSKLETIIDSGATEHFSGQRADFINLKRWHEPRTVLVADGKEVLCEGTGTIELKTPQQTLTLNGVWYVPKFQRVRLISVFRLNDAGIEAQFVNHRCVLWKGNTKLITISGSNGLYKFPETSSSPDSSAYIGSSKRAHSVEQTSADPTTCNPMPKVQEPIFASNYSIFLPDSQAKRNIPNDESVWTLHHRRLGHVNFRDIKKMVELGLIRGSIMNDKRPIYHGEKQCEACLAGRLKENFNKKTDNRQHMKARRLHADISGIQGLSIRGFKYFLIVVDDATRMYWIRLLKTKNMVESSRALREIIATIELESGEKVVYFRADNGKSEFGTEFTNMLTERGIQFEPCPPYKHSMNGVAERAIGLISTYARSMLYESQLPSQFWDYAVEHAVWIRNRMPTSSLPFGPSNSASSKSIIPYSAWHERPPKLVLLRPFGCVSTLMYPKSLHPQKWTPNIRNGTSIFVGLRGESIHKLISLETLQMWESADAKVDEYSYAVVNLNQENGADNPLQAIEVTPTEYVPMPIVGRPKGVRQKRVNCHQIARARQSALRDSVPNEVTTSSSKEQLDSRLVEAREASDQRSQEVRRHGHSVPALAEARQ